MSMLNLLGLVAILFDYTLSDKMMDLLSLYVNAALKQNPERDMHDRSLHGHMCHKWDKTRSHSALIIQRNGAGEKSSVAW